jgi:hypothetical protein
MLCGAPSSTSHPTAFATFLLEWCLGIRRKRSSTRLTPIVRASLWSGTAD